MRQVFQAISLTINNVFENSWDGVILTGNGRHFEMNDVGFSLVAYTADHARDASVGQTGMSAHFFDGRIDINFVWGTSSGAGCTFGQTGMSAPP